MLVYIYVYTLHLLRLKKIQMRYLFICPFYVDIINSDDVAQNRKPVSYRFLVGMLYSVAPGYTSRSTVCVCTCMCQCYSLFKSIETERERERESDDLLVPFLHV